MVLVEHLSVTYRQTNASIQALKGVTFSVEAGETCAIIGPSGCGKTTLLYVLAGLRTGFSGRVLINGQPVRPQRRETALILQDYGLLPWKTVWQNVILGPQLRGLTGPEIFKQCETLLHQLGLADLGHLFPGQLSGGQRQRVAIARALAVDPDLLLMDEPFSSLDALTREMLQDNLLAIWKQKRLTVVIVTHSIEEAVYLGRKIIVLSPRPAHVIAQVDNPGVGTRAWRKQAGFYHVCSRLRELLQVEGG